MGASNQSGSAEEVARRNELGPLRSSTTLKTGMNFVAAVALTVAATVGAFLLFALGVPTAPGHIALIILLAPFTLLCGAAAVSAVRDGFAARGLQIYVYERGLVAETKADPLPLPYADLLVYRGQINHTDQLTGLAVRTDVNWRVFRRDNTPWEFLVVSTASFDDLLESTLVKACEAQASSQAALLAAGSTLTYGSVSFSSRGVVAEDNVTWTEVDSVNLSSGRATMKVRRAGHPGKVHDSFVGMVGNIPNFPLFWQLFQQAFADSRPGYFARHPQTDRS
jgi:hypothetical protein